MPTPCWCDSGLAQPGIPVGTSGDTTYVTDGNDFLIQVAAPAIELQLLARFTRSLAALWQHAATPEREPVTV